MGATAEDVLPAPIFVRVLQNNLIESGVFKRTNAFLELNAVRLCKLEENHKVLEVGFGPGIGLKRAAEVVVSGSGKVHGIDFSPEMVRMASKLLEAEVEKGKVELVLGDAAYLPYRDNTMDRIFHCNCYYFWTDADQVARELLRVLKPDGFMVTTINLVLIKAGVSRGYMKYGNWDPRWYMNALKRAGFTGVEMKTEYCDNVGKKFQAIYAHKQKAVDL